jgi:hypothetical protein
MMPSPADAEKRTCPVCGEDALKLGKWYDRAEQVGYRYEAGAVCVETFIRDVPVLQYTDTTERPIMT